MKRPILLSLVGSLLVAGPAVASGGAATGPMSTLKSYNERLDKVLRKKESDAAVDKNAVKSLAGELIDYRELARRALAQHWDKLTPAQRDDFVTTFSQMIEKNYVKQLRGNVDYSVVYKNEAVQGDEAVVATVVKVRTKGKSTDVSIDYKMRRSGEKWQVFDVVTDEVSMLRNYRGQFNKIITSEGYDALLDKMRKRIRDADADAAQQAKG